MGLEKEEKRAQDCEKWWRNERNPKKGENDVFSQVWSSVFVQK